jgi:hypothetical protein
VDAGGEALGVGDLGQQGGEPPAFRGGQPRGDLGVVVLDDGPDPGQLLRRTAAELQGVVPPVVGVAVPLDQAASLQVVDQRDHPARGDAEQSGERLLADPGVPGQVTEQVHLGRGEPQLADPLGEPLAHPGPHLAEQEGHPRHLRRAAAGWFGRAASGSRHPHIIPSENHSSPERFVLGMDMATVETPAERTAPLPPDASADRPLYLLAALLTGSGVFHLGVQLVDGGPWEGPVSWRKPVTFGLSFGVVLATTVWATSFLRMPSARRRGLLVAFAAACALETAVITTQAWRRVPSHFNTTTTLNAVFAYSAAAGGAVLLVTSAAFAVVAFRRQAGLPPGTLLALRVGLVTFLVALAVGAAMIAEGVTTARRVSQAAAYLAPGWLKPVHAVWMHGLLLLLVAARLTERRRWPERRKTRTVAACCAGYVLAAAAVSATVLLTR